MIKGYKFMRNLVLILITLAFSGCIVTTVNPLYSPDKREVVFKKKLLGTWGSDSSDMLFTFKRSDKKVYDLVLEDKPSGETLNFETHLVKLKRKYFLDINMSGLDKQRDKDGKHLIMRVFIKRNTLRIMAFTGDFYFEWAVGILKFADLLNSKSSLVYANDTKSLQEYVLSCINVHGAFQSEKLFSRIDNI
jgi:hypothetical protein